MYYCLKIKCLVKNLNYSALNIVSHSVGVVVDLLHLPHKAAPDRHGVIPPPPPDGPAVACLPHTRRPHRTISEVEKTFTFHWTLKKGFGNYILTQISHPNS